MKKLHLLLGLAFLCTKVNAQALSGNYYIPHQAAGQKGYATLGEAVRDLNSKGVAGNVTFYINANTTETEQIYLAVNTQGHTVTIKPQQGTSPIIDLTNATQVGGGKIDGVFVIGATGHEKTDMVDTHNIVIDGSNTEGGTTRDLIIQGPVTTKQLSTIVIFGDNDNFTLKNCKLVHQSGAAYHNAALMITNVKLAMPDGTKVDKLPDNVSILNNEINAVGGRGADCIYVNTNGTPDEGAVGWNIDGNVLNANYTGIQLQYVDKANISNNTIAITQTNSSNSTAILLDEKVSEISEGVINVFGNKLVKLTTLNKTWANNNGIIGINNQYKVPKEVNIYNNMISLTGPSVPEAKDCRIYGIRCTGSATNNVCHNTIYIPSMLAMTDPGRTVIGGLVFGGKGDIDPIGGWTVFTNNIIVGEETTMKYHAIIRFGTSGIFDSNHNVVYNAPAPNAYMGYFENADVKTLAEWQVVSQCDTDSKEKAVNFVDKTNANLMLAGSSIGDTDLLMPSVLGYTTDITGAQRGESTYAGVHDPSATTSIVLQRIKGCNEYVGVEIVNDILSIRLEGKAQVEVYTVRGLLIDKVDVETVYTKRLKKGIYLVKVNKQVIKIGI